jgi:hypothetical protein
MKKVGSGWAYKALKQKRVTMEASVLEVSEYPLREQSY